MHSLSASWPAWPKGVWPRSCAKRDGLGQVLVQFQRSGNGAANLGDLDRVRQARAVQIAFVVDEYLGFVFQAPKRRAVNDTVAVALVFGAVRRARLGILPAARGFVGGSIEGKHKKAS